MPPQKAAARDCIFLRLDARFALGADDLQWILYKSKRTEPPSLDAPLSSRDWNPVSFVRSTKALLLRVLREKGCKPCAEAQIAWKAAGHARKGLDAPEGGPS